jgi:hypothetical protein
MGFYLLDYNPGTPQYTFPRRGGAQLSGTCIIHTAECLADNIGEDTSAEGCANMIANRADWGSYHCLCDSDSIIEMAPWEYEVWGDTETNNWAVHISAALRTTDWLTMPADRRERVYRNMATCAAKFVRHMAGKGISVPLRRITGAEARARVPGFCAHGDSGISRSDPGVHFDWALFFRYTQEALNNGGISPQGTTTPKEWDEMASKEEIKEAFREVAKEGPAGRDLAWFTWRESPLPGWNGEVSAAARIAGTDQVVNDIRGQVVGLTELVKQLSIATGVVIDYKAIASAVNDDAAKRLAA